VMCMHGVTVSRSHLSLVTRHSSVVTCHSKYPSRDQSVTVYSALLIALIALSGGSLSGATVHFTARCLHIWPCRSVK
jgi:hypothetical protein